MENLKKSDFTKKGIEFITRKDKIGYKAYIKFKAPKKVNIEGVGMFTFKSSWNHQVFGKQYIYTSNIFEDKARHAYQIRFF